MVTIRKFTEADIADKVRWINDPEVNRFLHYDLPLEEEKTKLWFRKICEKKERFDGVIESDGVPCGLIGLLDIDEKNRKAELYLTLGETSYKRRGVSYQAVVLMLDYAFAELGLNKVYLYTETANIPAQRLFEKVGFHRDGLLRADLYYREHWVDRYAYAILNNEFDTEE